MTRVRTKAALGIVRGEMWSVDFEPQSQREEPGKTGRPALVVQTDALNEARHATTIVVPGAGQLGEDDLFPLRVRLNRQAGLWQDTDLLIDQIRAISNRRLMRRLGTVDAATLARVDAAVRWLTGE